MNIKKLVVALFFMLAWIAFMYGCISFFYMETNPKLWAWDGRFFQVFFGFVLSIAVGVVVYSFDEE